MFIFLAFCSVTFVAFCLYHARIDWAGFLDGHDKLVEQMRQEREKSPQSRD